MTSADLGLRAETLLPRLVEASFPSTARGLIVARICQRRDPLELATTLRVIANGFTRTEVLSCTD